VLLQQLSVVRHRLFTYQNPLKTKSVKKCLGDTRFSGNFSRTSESKSDFGNECASLQPRRGERGWPTARAVGKNAPSPNAPPGGDRIQGQCFVRGKLVMC